MTNAEKPQNSSNSHDLQQAAQQLGVYNTATHATAPFEPVVPGHVGMYVCGATVQSSPHIGHIRAAVAFDIVRRWLQRLGFKVTFVRNVTDIDDKILDKAAAAGQQWWERAYIYEREFTRAYEMLGVLPPTYEPRATGHIGDMAALIQRLIDNGHAYVIYNESGEPTGDVFFDVASWPHYGELTRQKQNDANASTGADDTETDVTDRMGPSVDKAGDDKYNPVDPADWSPDKRDPRDFALWKASKESDPQTARWTISLNDNGKEIHVTGRPGWHIECSAMSHRYLYDPAHPTKAMFDIHGGGLDLRFPHHENEMAQTRAAGWDSANVWMHSAWVTAKGEKMSKSLGNGLSVPAVLAQNSAWVVRYALGSVHYRSMLEWSDQTLAEAQAAYERINNFVTRAGKLLAWQPSRETVTAVGADDLPADFAAAMNDDFNVSGATAAIFNAIREGNKLMESAVQAAAGSALRSMLMPEMELLRALSGGKEADDDAKHNAYVALQRTLLEVRAMLDTLGLDPLAEPWNAAGQGAGQTGGNTDAEAEHKLLDSMIRHQLQDREAARAARNFDVADKIRDGLKAMGVVIEDGRDGSTWSLDL